MIRIAWNRILKSLGSYMAVDIRVIPSCLGVNQLDCQFAAAAVYFEPEVSAFMIGLDFSQFYIAGVFQGESVRSLGTDFGRLTPSPPLCFLNTCVWCSTVALCQSLSARWMLPWSSQGSQHLEVEWCRQQGTISWFISFVISLDTLSIYISLPDVTEK